MAEQWAPTLRHHVGSALAMGIFTVLEHLLLLWDSSSSTVLAWLTILTGLTCRLHTVYTPMTGPARWKHHIAINELTKEVKLLRQSKQMSEQVLNRNTW